MAVGVGVFVSVFLAIFQPFGLSEWQSSRKGWALIGYGMVTCVAMLLHYFGIKRGLLKGSYTESEYTVGREIGSLLSLLLLISVGNHTYSWVILDRQHAFHNDFLDSMLVTFLVGAFPVVVGVLSNYIYQLKRYSHPPQVATRTPADAPTETLLLVAENGKDQLRLSLEQFLYAEAADNYVMVFYWEKDATQRTLLRTSLSRLEEQHASQPDLVRCHRSFWVNLAQVERVSGNAQGYKLHLRRGAAEVPVARRYNATLVARFK